MKKTLLSISLLSSLVVFSQEGRVGINTVTPKSTLEIAKGTANTTQDVEGILIPRVSKEKAYLMANATTTPEESTMVYVNDSAYTFPTGATDAQKAKVGDITENGYYFWNTTKWVKVSGQSGTKDGYWAQRNVDGTTETYLVPSSENESFEVKYVPNYGFKVSGDLSKSINGEALGVIGTVNENTNVIPEYFSGISTISMVGTENSSTSPKVKNQRGITSHTWNYGTVENMLSLKAVVNNVAKADNIYGVDIVTRTQIPDSNGAISAHTVESMRGVRNRVDVSENGTVNTNHLYGIDNKITIKNATTTNNVTGAVNLLHTMDGASMTDDSRGYASYNAVEVNGDMSNNDFWATRNTFNLRKNTAQARNVLLNESVMYSSGESTSLLGNMYAFRFWNSDPTNWTSNRMYGMYLDQITNGQQSNYGLYINNVGNTTATNNYAIYTNNGGIRFGDLPASTVATDKVVVADADGVLKTKEASSLVAANAEWKYDATTKNIDLVKSGQGNFKNKVYYTENGAFKNIDLPQQDRYFYNTFTKQEELRTATDITSFSKNELQLRASTMNTPSNLLADAWGNKAATGISASSYIDEVPDQATVYTHNSQGVYIPSSVTDGKGLQHLTGNSSYLMNNSSVSLENVKGITSYASVGASSTTVNLMGLDSKSRTYSSNLLRRIYGGNSTAQLYGTGDVKLVAGQRTNVVFDNNSTSNVDLLIGNYTMFGNFGGAQPTIKDAIGFLFDGFDDAVMPNMTNYYGIKLDDVQGATTANYSIHTGKGLVRLGDLPASTVATDKVVVADADGVLKTKEASSLVAANSEWETADVNGETMTYLKKAKAQNDIVAYKNNGNYYLNLGEGDVTKNIWSDGVTQGTPENEIPLLNVISSNSLPINSTIGSRKSSFFFSENLAILNNDHVSAASTATNNKSYVGFETKMLMSDDINTDVSGITGGILSLTNRSKKKAKFIQGAKTFVTNGITGETLSETDRVVSLVSDAKNYGKANYLTGSLVSVYNLGTTKNIVGSKIKVRTQEAVSGSVPVHTVDNIKSILSNTDVIENATIGTVTGIENNVKISTNTTVEKVALGAINRLTIEDGVSITNDKRGIAGYNETNVSGVHANNDFWAVRNTLNLKADNSQVRNVQLNESVSYSEGENTVVSNLYGFKYWNPDSNNWKATVSHQGILLDEIKNGQQSNYGLYINNVGNATATKNHAIYTNAGTIRFGDLPASTVATDKIVVADADGVLKTKDVSSVVGTAASKWTNDATAEHVFLTTMSDGVTSRASQNKSIVIGDKNYIEFYNPGSSPLGSKISLSSPQGNVGIGIEVGDGTGQTLSHWSYGVDKTTGRTYIRDRVGSGNHAFTITKDVNNVGIGTITPTEKLEVAGKVKADSYIATVAGANVFPDYVFEKYYNGNSTLKANYNFKSLDEVEHFVKEKGHLPGYTSAKEIAEQGKFNMTEVQLTNVEKIEELYLHTIEQEKKIEVQNSILEKQHEENIQLKEKVERLEKLVNQVLKK